MTKTHRGFKPARKLGRFFGLTQISSRQKLIFSGTEEGSSTLKFTNRLILALGMAKSPVI